MFEWSANRLYSDYTITVFDYVGDGVVLCPGVKRDGVHAEPSAVVAGLDPGPLGIDADREPREVIPLVKILIVDRSCKSWKSFELQVLALFKNLFLASRRSQAWRSGSTNSFD